MNSNLVFDIGMHYGLDTEFYLMKGFRVVAVEANPIMARDAQHKFARYLQSEQLAIENVGIWDAEGDLTFYRNLDKDDWSSFGREAGCRNNTRHEEMTVRCVRVASLIAKYGVPYYMKIDVEGADKLILRDLLSLSGRPKFISAEEYGVDVIKDLARLGYERFQIVPQMGKIELAPPVPAREGSYTPRTFSGHDSGLFGKELPASRWKGYDEAITEFLTSVRDERYVPTGVEGEWYDVHAMQPRSSWLRWLRARRNIEG
jgi:FkbM family methyltransferase